MSENPKILLMEKQIKTANPLKFKLRLVWGFETGCKLVAEFPDCKWIPKQGDIMVLPMEEKLLKQDWHKFKVANVIYDFEAQVVRVTCAELGYHKTVYKDKIDVDDESTALRPISDHRH